VISVYRQNLIINRDDNHREKILIFLQYIEYYSFTSIHIYLWNIYVIRNYKFNMYEPNIYVKNNKFVSIADNINVLQLSPGPWGPFYITENLPRVDGL